MGPQPPDQPTATPEPVPPRDAELEEWNAMLDESEFRLAGEYVRDTDGEIIFIHDLGFNTGYDDDDEWEDDSIGLRAGLRELDEISQAMKAQEHDAE